MGFEPATSCSKPRPTNSTKSWTHLKTLFTSESDPEHALGRAQDGERVDVGDGVQVVDGHRPQQALLLQRVCRAGS